MTKELTAILGGRRAASVTQGEGGRLGFSYERDWQEEREAFWVSLSLPLTTREHQHEPTDAYLWNLLPDNARTLERWGQQHHVSPRNAFALLSHVGEDCAGAIQLVRPERIDEVMSGEGDGIDWLDEAQVEERLAAVRQDPGATRGSQEGQFSLAGAQPKIALLFDGERFGLPKGRVPTTHILKPPRLDGDWPFLVENEHLCLRLARGAGIPAARTAVRRFGEEQTIVVTRFDRVTAEGAPGGFLRVHQEDTCQAMGMRPERKYQNEGGPDPVGIIELLRAHSVRPALDIATFIDALAFNWLIGGTDGHGKNYGLLHDTAGAIRLAPLYDIASYLPYEARAPKSVKLAMKIGGEYGLDRIRRRHWEKLAEAAGEDGTAILIRLGALADRLVEVLPEVRDIALSEGLDPEAVETVLGPVVRQIDLCRRRLDAVG